VVRTVWIQRTGAAAYAQRHLPTGGVSDWWPPAAELVPAWQVWHRTLRTSSPTPSKPSPAACTSPPIRTPARPYLDITRVTHDTGFTPTFTVADYTNWRAHNSR
jgi:hypothetical protein